MAVTKEILALAVEWRCTASGMVPKSTASRHGHAYS